MSSMHVKKGDTVVVNSGSDKGKKGKVLVAYPKTNKVLVEGVNVRSKHTKPKKAGEAGGIVKSEVAINASKVNVLCSKCGKGVRTKIEIAKDGTKTRVCAKCGAEIK
ncbi:MAG: 50S ribosomal protein L24 [Clostridia bacterium]|nr:50S ribosomal protein L24 [Clostridia bacterium]